MKKLSTLLLLPYLLLLSCGTNPSADTWQRGEGEFIFTGYAPLAHKPILVRYYIPETGRIRNMPVLFAMHGAARHSQIAIWKEFAERDGFIVIAPEYCREYWNVNWYQQGGIFTDSTLTVVNPREKWTFNTIEAIFDLFKKQTGNRSKQYDINGHSAGGQFVHRMVLAMPEARIRLAVAANPSSWTYPFVDGIKDQEGNVFGWPYSVKGTPFANDEAIKHYLSARMIIHLGTTDTSTTVHDLDRAPGAMATGAHRFERGNAFIEAMQRFAKERNIPLNWSWVEVDQVGHCGQTMVYGKIKSVDAEGNSTFCIDHITTTGAYYLIFGPTANNR